MPDINIEKLGSEGDGIGRHQGRPVFVAGTLPGEIARVDDNLPNPQLIEILQASAQRQEPACPHFDLCGGCAFQHATLDLLLEWKRDEVKFAFANVGIDAQIDATFATSASSRRRVTFTCKRASNGEVHLGFKQRRSEELVDISRCTILLPELEAEIPALRDLCKTLIRGNEEIHIAINHCDNGMDLAFLLPQDPNETMTANFVRAMAKSIHLRGSVNGDVLVEKEKPLVHFGSAVVALPPGGFMQAVATAEGEMARIVCKHLGGRKRVVDLFSGSGTFALRLAQRSRVHAVEMDDEALKALHSATGTRGLKAISVQNRDLHELPLTLAELKPFDGVCLDPPRAGAEAQCALIADSNIRSLAYVSCNPTSLARDVSVLLAGGFQLQQVVPIDQFVYSPHVEVVALLTKKPDKSTRPIFR